MGGIGIDRDTPRPKASATSAQFDPSGHLETALKLLSSGEVDHVRALAVFDRLTSAWSETGGKLFGDTDGLKAIYDGARLILDSRGLAIFSHLIDSQTLYGTRRRQSRLQTTPKFVCTPIPTGSDRKYIRLLRLKNRRRGGLIECEIECHPLGDVSFEALSYCWGKESASIEIVCNDSVIKITPSLAAALADTRVRGARQGWSVSAPTAADAPDMSSHRSKGPRYSRY